MTPRKVPFLKIDQDTLTMVLAYIARQPWEDVNHILQRVHATVRPLKKPKEPKPEKHPSEKETEKK